MAKPITVMRVDLPLGAREIRPSQVELVEAWGDQIYYTMADSFRPATYFVELETARALSALDKLTGFETVEEVAKEAAEFIATRPKDVDINRAVNEFGKQARFVGDLYLRKIEIIYAGDYDTAPSGTELMLSAKATVVNRRTGQEMQAEASWLETKP